MQSMHLNATATVEVRNCFRWRNVGVKHMESFIPLWQWLWLGIQSFE